MHRERHARLQAEMAAAGLDGPILLGPSAVTYATGALLPGVDSSHGVAARPIALVAAGAGAAHVFTPYPEGVPAELGAEFVHAPLYLECDEGMADLGGAMAEVFPASARLACDELTHAMLRYFSHRQFTSAAAVLAAAKICKKPDELVCIRTAQRLNEVAMWDVQRALQPGLRQTDLSARFLRRAFELGAGANAVDPIWQIMPATRTAGPWTTHGDFAFPTPSADRSVHHGDVIWVDSGITYQGYASDFGRTCIAGARPTARQQAQFERWSEVVGAVLARCRPGVSALEWDGWPPQPMGGASRGSSISTWPMGWARTAPRCRWWVPTSASRSTDEVACIERAAAMAEAALSALVAALAAGVTERSLVGAYLAAIAGLEAPTPPSEGVVCATLRRGPVRRRRLAGDGVIGPGERVALNPGAFHAGYEATLGRTRVAGDVAPSEAQRRLARRCRDGLDGVVAACRAGATGAEIQVAGARSGEPVPQLPFVRGVGLGAEPPLIGARVGASARLEAGMVLALEGWVAEKGAGGVLEQDMVLVTDDEPEVLTRYNRGAPDADH